MSHLSVIRTELRNLTSVQASLKRLGYQFSMGGKVKDYFGVEQEVDLKIDIPGQQAVGLRRDPETGIITLIGDWWQGKVTEQEFMDSIRSGYAREQVLESLEQQGLDLSKVREVEEPDGTVVFEVELDDQDMAALAAGA